MRGSGITMGGGTCGAIAAAVAFSCLVVIVEGWCLPMMTTTTTTLRRSHGALSTQGRQLLQELHTSIPKGASTRKRTTTLSSSSTDSSGDDEDSNANVEEVSGMRLSEIKSELKERKVDFSDCFDKESMIEKLADARKNNINNNKDDDDDDDETNRNSNDDSDKKEDGSSSTTEEFDRETALEELKGMRVRELREELGRRRIPRAGLFEKEDIVNALLEARQIASKFSATGLLTPGEVSELPGSDVKKEIDHPSLLLLDVYATWCGPCQMIAPILKEIAADEGDKLRIIKMDSDKNQELSSELKVGGLPTLVLFQGGNEIDRIEGAPTKEQLVGWIDNHR